jgi:Sporulation and spore germination
VASRRTRRTRPAAALAAALALAACTAGVPRTGEVVTVSPMQPPTTGADAGAIEEGGGPAAGLADTAVAQGFISAMNTVKPEMIERWVMPTKAVEQVRAWSARTTVNVYHSFQPDPLVVEKDKRIVPVRLDMVGRLERGHEWTPRSDEDVFRVELQKAGAEWRVANPGKELWVRDVDFKKLYTPVEMFLVPAGGAAGRRLAPVPLFVRRAPPGTPAPEVQQARARDAVVCLLEGPSGRYVHLTSAIPVNTKLRSLVYDGGVVTVDLSSRFTDTSTGGSGELRVGQVVWTISRLIQTAQVRILVEGKQLGSIGLDSFQGGGRWQRNRPPIADLWPQRSAVTDADQVLFARGGELYTIPPEPNHKPEVIGFTAPSPKAAPTWSPDHRWIAFLASSGQEQVVWLLQPGAEAFPASRPGRLSSPSWNPDSSRLYVLNRTQSGTRLLEVTRRTLGAVERELPPLPGGMRPSSLAVSPDGAWVLAVADHGDPQPGDGGGQLFLGRFGPEGVLGWLNRPIAPGLGRVFSPVWVDAVTVAFIAETDNKDDIGRLWVMKRDGWDPTPILNADPEDATVLNIGRQLTVNPSGSDFIFTVRSPTGASLSMVDRQGISPRPLTLPTAEEFDTDPSFASR